MSVRVQDDRWLTVIWGLLAAFCAVMIVALPLEGTIAILAIIAIAVLSAFTPLTTLAFLLILAPLRTLIATEATVALPLDIGQLFFVLFIAVWLSHRIIYSERLTDLAWTPLYYPLGGFIIASGLTVITAYSLHVWVSEWLKWLLMLGLITVVMHLGRGQRWQWIVLALLAGGVANALVGLYIFFGGSGADHLLINGRFFRAFGTFGQPNPFGGYLGLLLPLAIMTAYGQLVTAWQVYDARHRIQWRSLALTIFYAGITLILLAGLIASWSRGAWLGFLASVAVMGFVLPRKLYQRIGITALGASALLGVWVGGLLPSAIVNRLASSFAGYFTLNDVRGVDITSANYAIVERLAHWQAALNMAQEHFWLGVGLGNYDVAYAQFRLINWDFALGHAHNYYLNMFAEAGFIGLIAYLGLWLSISWINWQALRHPDHQSRALAVGLLGTWTYLSVHSLLDNLYVNNMFIHMGIMFGLLALIYHQTKQGMIWGTDS